MKYEYEMLYLISVSQLTHYVIDKARIEELEEELEAERAIRAKVSH